MNHKHAVTLKLPAEIITYARNRLGPVLQKLLHFYSWTFPPRLIPMNIILKIRSILILLPIFAALFKISKNKAKKKKYENKER